jgi:hypothetical protein
MSNTSQGLLVQQAMPLSLIKCSICDRFEDIRTGKLEVKGFEIKIEHGEGPKK